MYRTIARLFFLLSLAPSAATAAPLDLFVAQNPDIMVSPVSVNYDAGTSIFEVDNLFGPSPAGSGQARDPDGNDRAGEGLVIDIDVRISDDAGTPVAESGGTGLRITGTIYDDNTTTTPEFQGDLLLGTLIDVGFDGSIIELGWELTGGSALSWFETELPEIIGVTRINASPYFVDTIGFGESFSSEGVFTTSTDTLAATIPLPAGLPLLLSAIASIGIARRFASRTRGA